MSSRMFGVSTQSNYADQKVALLCFHVILVFILFIQVEVTFGAFWKGVFLKMYLCNNQCFSVKFANERTCEYLLDCDHGKLSFLNSLCNFNSFGGSIGLGKCWGWGIIITKKLSFPLKTLSVNVSFFLLCTLRK